MAAVYDDQDQPNDLDPSELKKHEEEAGEEKKPKKDNRPDWQKAYDKSREEDAELASSVGSALQAARDKDAGKGEKEEGFFKDDDKQIGRFKRSKGRMSAALKNRVLLTGVGGGVAVMLVVAGTLFSFLNVFKLDHFIENIDAQTFSRFNASFQNRSDTWTRAYVRLRLAELNGDVDPDRNPYFRANKVDTDNPIKDWYRTMRSSSFEADLAKEGIVFANRDGGDNIKFTVLQINDKDALQAITANDIRNNKVIDMINDGTFDGKVSDFFDSPADSNRQARQQIRKVVNENTRQWSVFKRRQLRKDIANMTGISSWRLFEKTRDKIDDKKINMQKKILSKVFPEGSNTGKFLKCMFGVAKCPSTTDAADPDNSVAGSGGKDGPLTPDDSTQEEGEGGKKNTTPVDSGGVSDTVEGAAKDATSEVAEDAAEDVIELTPTQAFVKELVSQVTSATEGPAKIWNFAKKLASVHRLFSGGSDSKVAKLVKTARLAQLIGFYTTYSIARDQMKSGELVGDEMNSFSETTSNMDKSEGWAQITANKERAASGNSVYAAATETKETELPNIIPKDTYCRADHQKTKKEFNWFCDDQKPNNGGSAESISKTYDSSVGVIIAPIANAVSAVEGSIIGKVADFGQGLIDKAVDTVLSPVLEATGLQDKMSDAIGFGMTKVVEYSGAGPMDMSAGVGNLVAAGSAGAAETATRQSGGVRSTAETKAASIQLAVKYAREKRESESTYDRYVSLNNPDSLASNSLFSVGTSSSSTVVTNIANALGSLPKTLASLVNRSAFAQQYSAPSSEMADWAGVDTYDTHPVCQNLDPLSPDYIDKGTNANEELGLDLDYDLLTNGQKFWSAVYEKIGDVPDAQQRAEKIYNCLLLDTRVRGSLGAVHGYTNDDGYGSTNAGDKSPATNPGGGLGVSPDGFVFPQQTTQSRLKADGWCYNSLNNCHHDYNAADIFAPTGTVVVAARGGLVVSAKDHDDSSVGSRVVIKGEDGLLYYYAHMGDGTVKVQKGQTVKAGDQLGNVGTSADAMGTPPHTHFDILPSQYSQRMGCSGASCSQYPFINPQPVLVEAFKHLPQ